VSGADDLIPVLYKYYMTMSLARQEFYSYLNRPHGVPRPDADDAQNGMEFLFSKPGIMMSYWYGILWVVIDGWEQTGLSDSEIEELLKSPGKRKQLWDFRNSLFHFQKELLPAKQQPLFADRSFVEKFINGFSQTAFSLTTNPRLQTARIVTLVFCSKPQFEMLRDCPLPSNSGDNVKILLQRRSSNRLHG
jgi:hypothetical protein